MQIGRGYRTITYDLEMAWRVKSRCAEHHRAAVEHIVNFFSVPWLLTPRAGEVFDNLEHCNRRLRAWAYRPQWRRHRG